MANITAQMVKELREMTRAGMMDCKMALVECDGDMEKAVDFLKEKGLAKAAKKAGRIAAEGLVKIAFSCDKKTAALVEVNSETDFVSKNEEFVTFVEDVAKLALTAETNDIEAFKAMSFDGATVEDALTAKVAKIGEKLSIRRFEKVTGDVVASYVHGGGRIGVLVVGNGEATDATKEALTNVAMQVAAMNPQYVSRNDISADELVKMKEITLESALNDPFSLPKQILQGLLDKAVAGVWGAEDVAVYTEKKNDKSFNMNYLPNFLSAEAKAQLAAVAVGEKAEIANNKIFSGLVEGRVSKQLKEICLLDQVYVRAEDGKQTVGKYLESVSKDLSIAKVVRFEVGEGIEKKNENFAEEVAKQMNA
ncbi:MAG: translation elongation factor Ts [Clostridia bacterium]|nr:translation elongation factor Ts [Clostridia bacterium]